jgi:hypothetical protein
MQKIKYSLKENEFIEEISYFLGFRYSWLLNVNNLEDDSVRKELPETAILLVFASYYFSSVKLLSKTYNLFLNDHHLNYFVAKRHLFSIRLNLFISFSFRGLKCVGVSEMAKNIL